MRRYSYVEGMPYQVKADDDGPFCLFEEVERLRGDDVMTIDEEIGAWNDRVHPDADLPAKFRKLGEEVGELGEALMRFQHYENNQRFVDCRMEVADCAIVLSHMARLLGAESLDELMRRKFKVLLERENVSR